MKKNKNKNRCFHVFSPHWGDCRTANHLPTQPGQRQRLTRGTLPAVGFVPISPGPTALGMHHQDTSPVSWMPSCWYPVTSMLLCLPSACLKLYPLTLTHPILLHVLSTIIHWDFCQQLQKRQLLPTSGWKGRDLFIPSQITQPGQPVISSSPSQFITFTLLFFHLPKKPFSLHVFTFSMSSYSLIPPCPKTSFCSSERETDRALAMKNTRLRNVTQQSNSLSSPDLAACTNNCFLNTEFST